MYERVVSTISPGLLLGSDAAAKDEGLLQQHGVTHVINCAAVSCANHHPAAFTYLSLYLKDSLREDIAVAFYDALEFIDSALSQKGVVFVHCQHGVSRSSTIVLAYLMWRSTLSYEEALDAARAERPTINPNIGFACALLAWGAVLSPQPHTTQAWALQRALPAGIAAAGGDTSCSNAEISANAGPLWTMRSLPLAEAPSADGILVAALEALEPSSTPFDSDQHHLPCLVFLRGAHAACWIGAGGDGHVPPYAVRPLEVHWRRLQAFHRLPAGSPRRVVCSGSEDLEFWRLLHDVPPSPPTPMRVSSSPMGDNSGVMQMQMQTMALQHLVAELLLTLQLQPAAGSDVTDANATAEMALLPTRMATSESLIVAAPEGLSEWLETHDALLHLLTELTSALEVDPLATLRLPLEQFAAHLCELEGEALLQAEELLLEAIRQAAVDVDSLNEVREGFASS